jgi:isocitrate lyase
VDKCRVPREYKKCGHLGGKVLIPTSAHIRNLDAARLAADVTDVPTLIVARTDAQAAKLLTSDIDERDRPFVDYDAGRTAEGFHQVRNGIEPCIARAIACASHCDLIWMETSRPDLGQARKLPRRSTKRIRARSSLTIARGGRSSTTAMHGSTAQAQFKPAAE